MGKDSAARIKLGRSFHQMGTVNEKVCESDFVYVIYSGYFIYVICAPAVFPTCSQQHVCGCIAMLNSLRIVMTELY